MPPQKDLWQGRQTTGTEDYFYQSVKLLNIEAETLIQNLPGNRLLAKCGFTLINNNLDINYWELRRKSQDNSELLNLNHKLNF